MSRKDSLLRYTHIINKVKSQPSNLKVIMDYLAMQGQIHDFNFEISTRTFKRDLEDILRLYKIDIQYDPKRRVYFIEEDDQSEANNRMLEALNSFQILNMSEGVSNHITFERRRPKGTEHLFGLLHAIKNKYQVKMKYKSHWSEGDKMPRIVEPYALKESQDIWYVHALNVKDGIVKTFGLDRIADIEITSKKFKIPVDINTQEVFKYCFGINSYGSDYPEEIILSFDPDEGKFIKALPLHETQEVLVDNEHEYRIKLKLFLSYDFIMEVMSRGDRVEVIKPLNLRNTIIRNLKNAIAIYEKSKRKK